MASNVYDPLFALTPTDHGAIVVVVGYIFASITVVAACTRVFITTRQKLALGGDDVAALTGTVG